MDLRREDVSDLHVIVDLERFGDDVRAVEFFADDTAADGVSVKTDQKIKERGAVAYDQFAVGVDGA